MRCIHISDLASHLIAHLVDCDVLRLQAIVITILT